MKTQNDIASYVSSLRSRLHLRPDVAERIVAEAEAHLQDRAAAHIASGMDRREAESLAVAEFGPAWRVALRFRLAYLDVKKVLAWTVALLLIAYRMYRTYRLSVNPHHYRPWPMYVAILAGDMPIWLAFGFIVTTITRRRLLLGAAVISTAWTGLVIWLSVAMTRAGGFELAGHVWNGWQSGFMMRVPQATPYNQAHSFVLLRDREMIFSLLFNFTWTLMGIWAAGAIRARLARRSGRVVA